MCGRTGKDVFLWWNLETVQDSCLKGCHTVSLEKQKQLVAVKSNQILFSNTVHLWIHAAYCSLLTDLFKHCSFPWCKNQINDNDQHQHYHHHHHTSSRKNLAVINDIDGRGGDDPYGGLLGIEEPRGLLLVGLTDSSASTHRPKTSNISSSVYEWVHYKNACRMRSSNLSFTIMSCTGTSSTDQLHVGGLYIAVNVKL